MNYERCIFRISRILAIAGAPVFLQASMAATPCPPPMLSLQGGTTVSSSCPSQPQTDANLPTITLKSAVSGTGLPFALGQVFRKGAVPAGSNVSIDVPASQVSVLSTWDDGSAKHAQVAGVANLTAGVPVAATFSLGNSASGPAITEATLIAANPQASVTYGSYGTVNLTSLLGTSARVGMEHAGSQYAAFQYISPFPGEGSVRAVFYVQLWTGGKYRVRVAVENGTALVATGAKSGTATVSIAGATRYSGAVTTSDGARWDVVGSNSNVVTALHDPAYLRSTGIVPNYGYRNPASSTLSALVTAPAPMSRLGWEQDMGATGFSPGIGLLPHWDALYLATGDERALASSVAHSSALGSYPIFYRNTSTMAMPKFSDFPNAYSGSESFTASGNPNRWEIAHHPHAGFLAWVATAERFHLETMYANAFAAWYTNSGSGVGRAYTSQTRARAWRYRTISAVAALAPESDTFKADAKASIVANVAKWKADHVDTNSPAIGLAGTYDDQDSASGFQRSLFEHYFLVASIGWSWDQEMRLSSAERNNLQQVRDFFYRIPVGVTGRGPAAGEYCYQRATGPYRTTVGPSSGSFFQTWSAVYAATYGDSIPCTTGSPIEGGYADDSSPSAFPQSNWGHLITALSYATDHGAPGAAAGYARVIGASNWPTNAAKFNNWPQYGVLRRD